MTKRMACSTRMRCLEIPLYSRRSCFVNGCFFERFFGGLELEGSIECSNKRGGIHTVGVHTAPPAETRGWQEIHSARAVFPAPLLGFIEYRLHKIFCRAPLFHRIRQDTQNVFIENLLNIFLSKSFLFQCVFQQIHL